MAYRARNILIAVALAAVAALLTSFYVTSYKRHVQRGEDHVTTRRFGTQTELGVRAQLKGTDRAVQIWGDQTQLLAGTLKTGDHVDFVETVGVTSRVFLRNIKVLQAPSAPPTGSKLTQSIGNKSTVMLKLTDNQAQKVQWLLAAASSDDSSTKADLWHLALRPVTHDADSTDHVDTWWSVLTDGLTRAEKNLFLYGQRKSPKNNG